MLPARPPRRMRPRLVVLTLLALPSLVPLSAAQDGPAPLEAVGPDAEGAWRLAYEVTRPAAGPTTLFLHVRREDGAGVVEATRDLPPRELPEGASRVETPFLPAEGPGDYEVSLVADGLRGAPLRLRVDEGGGASATFSFDVADEPTTLALVNDSVNADGKLKTPGDAVLTRAVLRDGNGVADVTEVRWGVERGGVLVEEGQVRLPPGNATEAFFEVRFARSPLAAGEHRVHLVALKDGAPVAQVSRTFVSREVATVLVGGNLTPAVAGRATTLATDVALGDRNGAPAAGLAEWRLWRGSARVEGAAFRVEAPPLAEATRRPDVDGLGRVALPLRVHVPADATPGLHRASLYLDDALVGSLPFEVRKAPDLSEVVAEASPGGGLRLVARGNGTGHLVASAVDAAGARTSAEGAFEAGAGALTLPGPFAGPTRWEIRLLALAHDPTALDVRNGTWPEGAATPALRLAARHVSPRLPSSWRVEAEGWDVAGAAATVEVRRWDGAPAPNVTASMVDGLVRVRGPADLEAGRYDARLVLAWPNGTRGETTWSFEAGPWTSLALGAPQVSGREARIPVRNDGGTPIRRLVAEVEPGLAQARLLVDGATHDARTAGARRVFAGFELPSGASGVLVLQLPEGPLPAGARPAGVRVLALPGGG